MFLMARNMNYMLAGMAMDAEMLWGMALIVAGLVVTGYGLLPSSSARIDAAPDPDVIVSAPEDAPLRPRTGGSCSSLARSRSSSTS